MDHKTIPKTKGTTFKKDLDKVYCMCWWGRRDLPDLEKLGVQNQKMIKPDHVLTPFDYKKKKEN
eukprot:UN23326